MLDQNTMKAGFIRLEVIRLFGNWNTTARGLNKRPSQRTDSECVCVCVCVCLCVYCGTAGHQNTGGLSSPYWISSSLSSFSKHKGRPKVSKSEF